MALTGVDGVMRGRAATARRLESIAITRPEQAGTLASWLVTAPGQSSITSDFLVAVVHLRPIPGAPPAPIRVEGATHEILVMALDPSARPRHDDQSTLVSFTPSNVQMQWGGLDDAGAVDVTALLVAAVCDGWVQVEPPMLGDQSLWERALRGLVEDRLSARRADSVPASAADSSTG